MKCILPNRHCFEIILFKIIYYFLYIYCRSCIHAYRQLYYTQIIIELNRQRIK